MRKLTIYRRYLYNTDCYASGKTQNNKGVQIHSTGANNPRLRRYVQPDPARLLPNPNNNDWNHPGKTTCAGGAVGKMDDGNDTVACYLLLPTNYRVWLSGSGKNGNANNYLFGFEICEDGLDNKDYFNRAVKEQSVLFAAWLCQQYKVAPADIVGPHGMMAVMSHRELHDIGCASNHGDIDAWLRKFGYNMNDYRGWVADALAEGVEATVIDCDMVEEETIMYEAEVLSTGYLNLRAARSTSSASMAKMRYGEMVEVLDDSDKIWWKVKYKDMLGFAMSQYLRRIATEPQPTDEAEETLLAEAKKVKEELVTAVTMANYVLKKLEAVGV